MIVRDSRLFALAAAALRSNDPASSRTLVQDILDAATSPQLHSHMSGWLMNARDILHDRFSSHVCMREIAREIGRHHVHLSRAFAEAFDATMSAYLRQLRLARACELLLMSTHQLSHIAHSVGFADHAHFTRAFSFATGSTPSAYRYAHAERGQRRSPLYYQRCEPEQLGEQ